jgi:hypothetical protein
VQLVSMILLLPFSQVPDCSCIPTGGNPFLCSIGNGSSSGISMFMFNSSGVATDGTMQIICMGLEQ